MHYKLVKVSINAPGIAEVTLDIVIWYHGLPDSILIDRSSIFTL